MANRTCPPTIKRSRFRFTFAIGFVVIVEVVVNFSRIESGRVGDGLAGRSYEFLWCQLHVKLGVKTPEIPTVRLGLFQQQIHQFRFLAPGQHLAQSLYRIRSSFGWDRYLRLAFGHVLNPWVIFHTVRMDTLGSFTKRDSP